MSGASIIMMASGFGTHSLTVGTAETGGGTADVYGFNGGLSAGAITPATAVGLTINFVQTFDVSGTVTDLQVQLDTEVAQDAFTAICIEDGNGVVRQYDTASADAFATDAPEGTTTWTWGVSNNDGVYASGDVGKVRRLLFIP